MGANLLRDRILPNAVSSVPQRSEKQENVDHLVATFVDPGVSVQLENTNNQILYGRRGTGKTHVLKIVERHAGEVEAQLAIYIDMRKLGSSSLFEDEERPLHVRVAGLLRDVLSEIENALMDWATDPAKGDPPGPVFEELDALAEAITHSVLSDESVVVETEFSEEASRTNKGELQVLPTPAVRVGGGAAQSDVERERTVLQGRPMEKILFTEIGSALGRSIEAAGISQLVLLLDEWTAVPLDLQPLLAEFLKRALFPNTNVTVKIASLEYRSDFTKRLDRNNVLGFELGADISSALELDDYYVHDRNPSKTIEMFSELAYRHVAAEADAKSKVSDYLRQKYEIRSAPDFIRALFATPESFTELVRAGEGVARDFINIFSTAFFHAVRRDLDKIDMRAVRDAAHEWYEKDKAPNIDDSQARVLRRIIESVIGEKRARSFMIEKDLEKHEVIQSLFDFRLIHLVQRGYADKDRPGVRYNIFTLDYGTYVDLIGTQRAPRGDFSEELTEEDDVVVPFDDKRSIRRIILRAEHLEPEAEPTLFEATTRRRPARA